jgi:hypothetical protein
MPQRVRRPIDPVVKQKMDTTGKSSQRLTQRLANTRELEPLTPNVPNLIHEEGDDGSGLLPPMLLKTSELKDNILWLACPSDAALMVAQTTTTLVVYDLEELTLIGALGFHPNSPPVTRSEALGPAFKKPLGAVLPGLPMPHSLEINPDPKSGVEIDNGNRSFDVGSSVCDIDQGDTPKTPKGPEQFAVCCYSNGVSVVCSTEELRKYGQTQSETEKPEKEPDDVEEVIGFSSPSFTAKAEETEVAASSLVMRFSCADLASLCVGVAQWMKLYGGAEGSAIVDAFNHLTAEQRKNAALVVEAYVARPSSPTGTSLSEFNRTSTASSRGSRKSVSVRQSMTPSSTKPASDAGGDALVGELTAENLTGNNSKSNEANVLGFNQRFLPSSAYVLRELSSRQLGKHDRELRLLARRRELLELLPPN